MLAPEGHDFADGFYADDQAILTDLPGLDQAALDNLRYAVRDFTDGVTFPVMALIALLDEVVNLVAFRGAPLPVATYHLQRALWSVINFGPPREADEVGWSYKRAEAEAVAMVGRRKGADRPQTREHDCDE